LKKSSVVAPSVGRIKFLFRKKILQTKSCNEDDLEKIISHSSNGGKIKSLLRKNCIANSRDKLPAYHITGL
jgi:hypothetical protein